MYKKEREISTNTRGESYHTDIMSSVTTADISGDEFLLSNYVSFCEKQDTMEKLIDVSAIIMKITHRHGWPLFKMLENDDYVADSNFANSSLRSRIRILLLLLLSYGGEQ
jgi:hypothetical protein